jgi:chromosome segregation ATPase
MLGYRDGARAYQAKQALSSAESAVSSARSERDRLQDKIKAFEETLRKPGATDAEKAEARKRLDEVQRDLRRARDRIRDAESDRDRAGYALDAVRYDLGSRWGSW